MYCLLSHIGMSVIGQFVKKGYGGASSADSATGTWTRPSIVSGRSFIGVSQFSEVRCQYCTPEIWHEGFSLMWGWKSIIMGIIPDLQN